MKLIELAKELQITTESIKRFIQDFDLDLDECIFSNFEVKPDFIQFAKENADFLQRYEKDLNKTKSPDDIAAKIHQPKEKVEEILKNQMPQILENGYFKSSVSSFGIDNQLGGDYHFVYDYFGKKSPLRKKDFIGYRDLFFYISDALEPFINGEESKNWGIEKPAGIILYGPPGSGKIFWANKISEIIGYQFTEVKKHFLGTSYIGGDVENFNTFLLSILQKEKIELFIENFDDIMQERNANYSRENEETKEIIMHNVSRFPYEGILMIGSAISLDLIDEEVMAPGRFDVHVPIFPPNVKERAEMIQFAMLKNLEKTSTLFKILEKNNADHLPFWNEVALKMKAFSNTMVIDFTQSLKKRIRNQYQKSRDENLKIDITLLDGALRDSASKLTSEYLDQVQQFLHEVIVNNYDDFVSRIKDLQHELDAYKVVEEPRRAIGFQNSNGEKS